MTMSLYGKNIDAFIKRKSRSEYRSDMTNYECKECGYIYNTEDQEPPEDATFHWVPCCPWCNASMTSNPVTVISIYIALDMLRGGLTESDEDRWIDKIQSRARHLHGREVHRYND